MTELVQDPERTIERKLKEIIQSIRVTQDFPGEEGKQTIITAYLNQNYYGNQSYGVKAAVESYFGIPLEEITPAQAAIIAGLPKSPSNYDLVRNAVERCTSEVAEDAECPAADRGAGRRARHDRRRATRHDPGPPGRGPHADVRRHLQRRRLHGRHEGRGPAREPDRAALDRAALRLGRPRRARGQAVRPDAPTCDQLADGGLRVTTTLDTKLQKTAEKWVKAATIVPHAKNPAATAKRLGLTYEPWMKNLVDKNLRNGALVAQDYQTGEVIAYVGSADYYARSSRPRVPAAVRRRRQGLPAARLCLQAVQLRDRHRRQAHHGGLDADGLGDRLRRWLLADQRRPPRARSRPGPQRPPVLAEHPVGQGRGDQRHWTMSSRRRKEFGMEFQTETRQAGLSLALGVQEVRPVDLVSAYGALANGGRAIGHTTILTVKDAKGDDVADPYVPPEGTQVVSPQAAYIVTDILNGNTVRSINPFWGKFAISGAGRAPTRRRSRPARTTTRRTSTPTATSRRRRPTAGRPAPTPWSPVPGTATATTRRSLADRSAVLHRCLAPTSGRAS